MLLYSFSLANAQPWGWVGRGEADMIWFAFSYRWLWVSGEEGTVAVQDFSDGGMTSWARVVARGMGASVETHFQDKSHSMSVDYFQKLGWENQRERKESKGKLLRFWSQAAKWSGGYTKAASATLDETRKKPQAAPAFCVSETLLWEKSELWPPANICWCPGGWDYARHLWGVGRREYSPAPPQEGDALGDTMIRDPGRLLSIGWARPWAGSQGDGLELKEHLFEDEMGTWERKAVQAEWCSEKEITTNHHRNMW